MKNKCLKIITVLLILSLVSAAVAVLPIAKSNIFPNVVKPGSNDNFIKLQDKNVSAYHISWLRKLNIKEDILSSPSSSKLSTLKPVSKNPYTYTATSFNKEVDSYSKLFSLDDNFQKAAYLFYLNQIDTIDLIAMSGVKFSSKIIYLNRNKVVVPSDAQSNKVHSLMVDALYSFMDYNLYNAVT
ncbi:MAG TPA: hypothetical protein VFC76_03060, partial [Oscillospiraceae bacterium]|nr:hypothetical protein [Oscillospiraceae bacterium]